MPADWIHADVLEGMATQLSEVPGPLIPVNHDESIHAHRRRRNRQ
jgi:hypothetical protein